MDKNVFSLLGVSLLAACSSLPSEPVRQAPETAPAVSQAPASPAPVVARKQAPVSRAASPEGDPLPNAELTDDLLFNLLAAEISMQRGQSESAFMAYMSAAQQTRDPRLARRAAEIALRMHQSDQAMSALRLWHQLAPHSEEASQYLSSLIVLTDNVVGARQIFEERLKQASPQTRGVTMLQIQRTLARAKDKAAAFATLDALLKPYRDSAYAHIALSQAAFDNNDLERAHAEATAALKLEPTSELAVLMLAQVTPDKARSTAVLSDHLKDHPDAREVRIAYARMLVEQEQYEKAKGEFETLVKKQPDDLGSIYALGMLAKQTGDLASAEKHLTTYLDLLNKRGDETRDPSGALVVLAQIAEERKDTEAALKWLSQIDSGDAYLGAQYKRAQILAKRGDLKAARQVIAALKPEGEKEQAQVIIADAQLLRDANQSGEAMKVLEAGLKRFPDSPDLLYDYAMAAEKLDRIDVMETTLKHLIEITPDNQHAYNALGYTLADRNQRLDEALLLITKALQLAPDDPYIMDSMGWVQFRRGDFMDAEKYLRRAYALKPDTEVAVHLGEVLWTTGRRDEAQKVWRDARTKDPKNESLRNTIVRLNVKL